MHLMGKHVPKKDLEGIIQKLQDRKRLEKEMNSYMARMKYLEKISKV